MNPFNSVGPRLAKHNFPTLKVCRRRCYLNEMAVDHIGITPASEVRIAANKGKFYIANVTENPRRGYMVARTRGMDGLSFNKPIQLQKMDMPYGTYLVCPAVYDEHTELDWYSLDFIECIVESHRCKAHAINR